MTELARVMEIDMSLETNTQVNLARHPDGAPKPEDFEVRDGPIPRPDEGQILVRNSFLSLDPYVRGLMKCDRDGFSPPYELGEPIGGTTVGTVTESRHAQYRAGDLVVGLAGC